MNKNKLKYIIDIFLGISFIIAFITGVVKIFKPYRTIPIWFSKLHDWSGFLIGFFVLAHLILNWSWIVCMTKLILKK